MKVCIPFSAVDGLLWADAAVMFVDAAVVFVDAAASVGLVLLAHT